MSRESSRVGNGAHLLLYDGVCGLCNGAVRFVLKHDDLQLFRFAALQNLAATDALKPFGGTPEDLSTFYVVRHYTEDTAQLLAKSRAVLFLMSALGWPWKAAGVFSVLPTSLADWVYDVVATHRYRIFGRYEQCLLPLPEYRDRFL